jgi:hypothetical protein
MDVDPARVAFLFGRVPTWADPDDPDDRSALLREQGLGRNDASSVSSLDGGRAGCALVHDRVE